MSTGGVRQLRHRRVAARRLPGGDPWTADLHAGELTLTPRQLEAWSQAANHIAADGLVPLIPIAVLRALHRRGGEDRELAERIHRSGGVAA